MNMNISMNPARIIHGQKQREWLDALARIPIEDTDARARFLNTTPHPLLNILLRSKEFHIEISKIAVEIEKKNKKAREDAMRAHRMACEAEYYKNISAWAEKLKKMEPGTKEFTDALKNFHCAEKAAWARSMRR